MAPTVCLWNLKKILNKNTKNIESRARGFSKITEYPGEPPMIKAVVPALCFCACCTAQAQSLTCQDAETTGIRDRDRDTLGISEATLEALGEARALAFPRGFGDDVPTPKPAEALARLNQIDQSGLPRTDLAAVYDHYSSVLNALERPHDAAEYARRVAGMQEAGSDAISNAIAILGRYELSEGNYCEALEYYFSYSCAVGGLSTEEFADLRMILAGVGAAENDLNIPKHVAQCRADS